jgi:hypothetical protein
MEIRKVERRTELFKDFVKLEEFCRHLYVMNLPVLQAELFTDVSCLLACLFGELKR